MMESFHHLGRCYVGLWNQRYQWSYSAVISMISKTSLSGKMCPWDTATVEVASCFL